MYYPERPQNRKPCRAFYFLP